jgi:hypothetical protein
MSGPIVLTMNGARAVLFVALKARRERPNGPVERDADRVAYEILRAQSGTASRPTVERIVGYLEENSTSDDGFNRAAWTELTKQVVVALNSNDPAKALKNVHVNTAPR